MPEDKTQETVTTETPAAPAAAQETASDDGMVELHKATIEDIDAELARAQAEEREAGTDEGASAAVQESESTTTPQQPGATAPAAKAVGATVATPGADPSKPQAGAAPRVYTEDEVQGLIAEQARLKKEGNQKELFIQHRGNELGALKQANAQKERDLSAMRAQLANGLEARFQENPVQATKDHDRIKEIDGQIEGLKSQEALAEQVVEAQTFFLQNVDIEKVSFDDVAAVLKEIDGLDDGAINAFRANPWTWTTPEALVQMGKRAMDRKEFIVADSDRKLLAKHVLHLNAELAKARARPGQVMTQVQKHLNQSPNVTAAASSAARPSLDATAIPRMSNAELDAALKHSMQQ